MAYKHLNIHERNLMAKLYLQGKGYREIGRLLHRHHTTISREFERYRSRYTNAYNPEISNNIALYWRLTPRHAKRRMYEPLYDHIINHLEQGHSPDMISGRLKITYPNDVKMRVSHETIYRWIYDDRLQRGELYKHLLRRHKRRIRRGLWSKKGGILKGRVSIHDRPESVNERKQIGDWEGDLMEGKRSTGYFLTYAERVSRFIIAAKLPTKEAIAVSKLTTNKLKKIKDQINSITYDNGKEFYGFKRIEKSLNTSVYFADPYSSWQRGTNEHANGMLRRFFPKGTDFNDVTDRQLKVAVDKINNRPRKILNYRTPAEVFYGASGALTM